MCFIRLGLLCIRKGTRAIDLGLWFEVSMETEILFL
jgi:hypothetical protein